MKCPWKTAQDINRYMGGCILMYDNFPYSSSYISQTKLSLKKITKINEIVVDPLVVSPFDDKLDITSPALGYYNHKMEALRLERQPYKQFSQGLTDRNTIIYDIEDNRRYEDESIFCQGVEDMLTGVYPSFGDAWASLQKQHSVAISLDVALARAGNDFPTNVYYKGDIVGYITPGSMKVIVPTSDRGWIISKYLDVFGWEVE